MKKILLRTLVLLFVLSLLPGTVLAAQPLVSQVPHPETGIVNPPVVVQNVTQALPNPEKLPAVAILAVDAQLNILSDAGAVLGTVADFVSNYRDRVVPAFLVGDAAQVKAVTEFVKTNGILDAFVLARAGELTLSPVKAGTDVYTADCPGAQLVKQACEQVNTLQGGLILPADVLRTDLNGDETLSYKDWAVLRHMAANDNHITQLIFEGTLPARVQTWYNGNGIAAWSWAKDAADVYSGIAAGSHAIVAEDPAVIYNVYESITATTLSGRPHPSAHRGVTMYHGSASAVVKGEDGKTFTFFGEAENTVEAVVAAWNYFGLMSAEVDPKITAACGKSGGASGECYHDCTDHDSCKQCQPNLILEHDDDLTTTTNIDLLRRDPKYAMIFDRGNSRSAYTLYELKLLTVTGRKNNKPSGTMQMATLEEVLAAADTLANGEFTVCCHVGSNSAAPLVDALLTEHPEYLDNVLIFSPLEVLKNHNWQNKVAAVPYAVAVGDDLSRVVDQESELALSGLINLLHPYDTHFMGYHYGQNTDGTDTFYYQAAARGLLSYHSVVTGQEKLNSILLTGEGAPGCRVEQPWMLDDWHYLVDAPAKVNLVPGEALDTTLTVKTILGDRFPEDNIEDTCSFVQLSGPALSYNEALGGYTAAEEGQAQIVYYYERKTDGHAFYRVYSQPVTVNITREPVSQTQETVMLPFPGEPQPAVEAEPEPAPTDSGSFGIWIAVAAGVLVLAAVVVVCIMKKKK